MRRLFASSLVLAALLLAGCAAPRAAAPGTPEDVASLRPETLLGETLQEAHVAAARAYADGDYPETARRYAAIVRRDPSDAVALYNLACAYGLMGSEAQAVAFLDAAWGAGFRNLAQIGGDPDFAAVRDGAAFQALLASFGERQAAAGGPGQRLWYEGALGSELLVVAPAHLEAGRRYPLVIGLHGWGGSAAEFAEAVLAEGAGAPVIWAFPQGLYAMPLPGRWSWFPMDRETRRAVQPARELAERSILAAVEAAAARYPVDPGRVYVTGFSQGGYLAYSLALRHPDRFRGAAPIGGWLVPDDYPAENGAAAGRPEFLVLHSPEDEAVDWQLLETSLRWLEARSVRHELWRYPGGHVVPGEGVRRIADWVAGP